MWYIAIGILYATIINMNVKHVQHYTTGTHIHYRFISDIRDISLLDNSFERTY